jgi:integrase
MTTEMKVLFYLKKNQPKANGLCPVMGRITIGKTMAQFSLKMEADADLWDTKAGRMKGKSKFALDINRGIDKTNLLILARYKELKIRQKEVKADELKCAMQGIAKAQDMLLDFCRKMNEALSLRIGIDRKEATLENYEKCFKELQSFLRKKHKLKDIPFRSLTYSFIDGYHYYLRVERTLKPNTASSHTIYLGKAVRDAVKQGLLPTNPFLGFKADKAVIVHKTLTQDELQRIMAVELRAGSSQSISRDIFVLACFTGLSYIDVKNLKMEDIVTMADGSRWIISRRQKTGTSFSVKLMQIPLIVIDKYAPTGGKGLIFPTMPKRTNVYNRLNDVARQCGINKNIGFHAGRHTFASLITLSEGVPIETVSRMLGHRSIKTTQIYAELSLEKVEQDIRRLADRIKNQYTFIP